MSRKRYPDRHALVALPLVVAAVCWLSVSSAAFAAPNSLPLRATYDASASIHWSRGTINVSSTAHVRNTTSAAVRSLAFNIVPLEIGAAHIISVRAGSERVTQTRIKGQTLVVRLPHGLRPHAKIDVKIRYRAVFNVGHGPKRSLLLQKDGIVTVYRWIPWLTRAERFKAPNFGETWVTAVSRRVTVRLRSDVPVKFATSGERVRGSAKRTASGNAATFTARNVRDFNFSASRDYGVTRFAWQGIDVRLYTRTESIKALTRWTLAALRRFTTKIGDYGYPQLTIAETPAGTGMESPAMSWISANIPRSRLAYTVIHEIAHQWFYAIVGNNQAQQPFLDEAMADFLTRDLLKSFRQSACAKSRLDGTTYDYPARCYPEVVYVQGGRYLQHYRLTVGGHDFWAGLRDFYRDKSFKIAGTRGLLDYLDAASGFNSRRHADRFPTLYP